MESYPIIALIGRPNVGKSVLFNKLLGRREAITSDFAGTTRDRHFGVMRWFGQAWTIVDTAGVLFDEMENEREQDLHAAIEEQVALAVEEATLIALVVDAQAGIQPDDRKLVELMRKYQKPLVLLVNKADNHALRLQAEEFHALGITPLVPISAIHGTGVRDFVDYLEANFPSPAQTNESKMPRVSFIGRPNVGKSTLLNQILGETRSVVSELPGTTRDTIEAEVTLPEGERFILIDTAGIRRRGKISAGIEKFSLFRTLRAINQSDIVVILLTIEEAPTRGDAHIASYALEAGKRVVIALNKTDLARDPIFRMSEKDKQKLGLRFFRRFAFLQRLPFFFVSGRTGQGVADLIQALTTLLQEKETHAPNN